MARVMKKPRAKWTFNPKVLGMGFAGTVFLIGDGIAAKVPNYGRRDVLKWLYHEADVARALYEAGISVPRPYGVRDVRLFGWRGIYSGPAFVMEHISGESFVQFGKKYYDWYVSPLYARCCAMREAELTKACGLGFMPSDCHDGNALYIETEDRIVLIDFSSWELPLPKETVTLEAMVSTAKTGKGW